MAPPQQFNTSGHPALAGRIQGFGNVNPPPVEDDTAQTVAKRAVGNLGSMLGEEVLLTVEDFKQKGAVGAVKDAVADAGDILIDGVAGIFGWIRGDPPPEEEDDDKAQSAASALTQGPAGAAYGVSQASPTGGINAVWVMPEEADPSTLAELAVQSRGPAAGPSQAPFAVPGGPVIQPYQPNAPMAVPGGPVIQPFAPGPMAIPGGPFIQPYQPTVAGARPPPFVPGANLAPPAFGGGFAGGLPSAPASSGAGGGGAKALVESIAKGDTIVGPEVAKRLVGQASNAKMTGKQLAEVVCERARRLYLGLDGSTDADAAMLQLLRLAAALGQQDSALAKEAKGAIADGISEELMSVQSSAKHRSEAEPLLRRVGLLKKMPEMEDLLGGMGDAPSKASAGGADLLGDSQPAPAAKAAEVDLLGGF